MKKKQLWCIGLLCGTGILAAAALKYQARSRVCRRRRVQRVRTGI